jgi:hypothetical protein
MRDKPRSPTCVELTVLAELHTVNAIFYVRIIVLSLRPLILDILAPWHFLARESAIVQ